MAVSFLLSSLLLRLLAMQAAADGGVSEDDDDGSLIASCLAAAGVRNVTTRHSPAYGASLAFSVQNLRFAAGSADAHRGPVAVVVPASLAELRASVRCAREAGVLLRLRSGGHSYEGLSYTVDDDAAAAFVVVDLVALDRVEVDAGSRTAWVQSGATLGQVYHAVAQSSGTLAFSAGSCPTVGSGGHIAGGGYGLLSRKYGLAGDNVVDAVLVDADGRVLDRDGMGEDVFWAIRGGGGGAWGAVYAWRVQLSPVPERVTVFVVNRPGTAASVARLVSKWQHVSPSLPDEFYLSATVGAGLAGSERTGISVMFRGLYLGPSQEAVEMLALSTRFPEMGLSSDVQPREMSWIESVVFFSGLPQGSSAWDLTDRALQGKSYYKAKSDFVRRPTAIDGLTGAMDVLCKQPKAYVILDPYGGAMDRIGAADLPFPHRRGNLHGVQYVIEWTAEDDGHRAEEYMDWLRRFYDLMGPYVSHRPRAAYINYQDLDLGTNDWSARPNEHVEAARSWGERYFLGNYDRLVRAKTGIDPDNVFRNAQSIPPRARQSIMPKVTSHDKVHHG